MFDIGFYLHGKFIPEWIEQEDGSYRIDPEEEKEAWDEIESDQTKRTEEILKKKGTSLEKVFEKLQDELDES